MHTLVTSGGWEFNAASFVQIGGVYYDLDDMTPEQRAYIGACLNVRGLGAAYAGKAVFEAEGLPPFHTVFPQIAQRMTQEQSTSAEAPETKSAVQPPDPRIEVGRKTDPEEVRDLQDPGDGVYTIK